MRKKSDHPLGPYPTGYAQLLARLAQTGWLCQGTVVCRPLRRQVGGRWVEKGPYYLWTGKRKGQTVCRALSQEQYVVAKQAIEANRTVLAILIKLQTLTLERILTKVPGVRKRK